MIINSIVQSIGGVSRNLAGLSFSYDVSTIPAGFVALDQFDSDVPSVQENDAVGITYNVRDSNNDFYFDVSAFSDGVELNSSRSAYTSSTVVSAVPVPAAVWLFGSGLLGLIGVARRKRANP